MSKDEDKIDEHIVEEIELKEEKLKNNKDLSVYADEIDIIYSDNNYWKNDDCLKNQEFFVEIMNEFEK